MTARMYSMQPDAVRKRAQRERGRVRMSHVPPPAASSSPPGVPPPAGVTSDVTPDVPPIASSGYASLLETEVVHGAGADAYAGPTVLGADDQGAGGTPLVTPEPEPPPPQTSPEEAKMIGKAVAAYCRFGWSELVTRHAAELDHVVAREQQAAVFVGGLAMVEQSATNLAIKYNVRIPWGDELAVGLGVGIATLGVMGKVKDARKPANDNGHAAAAARAKDATPSPSAPNNEPTLRPDTPSAAAQGQASELVL